MRPAAVAGGGAIAPAGGRRWIARAALALAVCSWRTGPAGCQARPHAVQPERPTVATHAGSVAPGWLEIETGVEADRFDDGTRGLSGPTFVKVGLFSHGQLSLGVPLVQAPGSSLGMGDLSAGIKWRLLDDARVLGDFAVLPSIKFPSGSRTAGRGTGTTDLSILAISSHAFGPVAMDLNLGYTRRNGDGSNAPKNATLWTASFGFPVAGALGGVAELYGYPRTTGPAGQDGIVALLAGPTYLIRPSLAIDAGVIIPLAGPQPRALYAGLVWNAGRVWGRDPAR
jgi:hypothetical protein